VKKQYWSSLEELESTAPAPADESSDTRSLLSMFEKGDRRSFLKVLGLSLAAGVLAGCRKPVEKVIPYLNQPAEIIPGVANFYATTCHGCSAECGALTKVMDGRPVKLEGNPDHRISQGGLCALGQGAVLGLYDSDRIKAPAAGERAASWEEVDREVGRRLATARSQGGKVVVLTGPVTGPARRAAIADFLAAFPESEHVVYDDISADALLEAHRLAYGRAVIPTYRFDEAEVIVSFGADFLGTWLSPVEFARQYAAGRDINADSHQMSRHFQFESRLSLTGSNADHRFAVSPVEQRLCAVALARHVAGELGQPALAALPVPSLSPDARQAVAQAGKALLAARGRGLVVSDANDPAAQAAVLALNEMLGHVGRSVDLARPSLQKSGRDADIARLIEEMRQGTVAVLLVHGCNPAYTYPQAAEFIQAMERVPCSAAFVHAHDETAIRATWQCAAHHPMESWGDAEPQAGRYSLFQPTIRPLYDSRGFEDSLLQWRGRGGTFHAFLQRYWAEKILPRAQAATWDTALQHGFVEAPPPAPARPLVNWTAVAAAAKSAARSPAGEEMEYEVFESLALRDGAAANNPWLQELPDPISKITWENYAAVAPVLAKTRGIREGQMVELTVGDRTVKAPAHLQPGQHARTISLVLGYGRTHAGRVGTGVGADVYPLIALAGGRRMPAGVIQSVRPLVETVVFARTQLYNSMEGRPIVREAKFAELHDLPEDAHHPDVSLWSKHEDTDYRWGMAIDLTKCNGCSACVVACNVENNIPVVGKDEVRRNREMHWMRIDRYYTGDEQAPRVVFQPMLCQHCGHASCEPVCPVLATVHDDQGLNLQVYNRCVGTRYCANNCPYKVRRFNFFNNISNDLTRNLGLNPDVTVRSRGVMEKCSFCIHRLQKAKIDARGEGRQVADGEALPACAQSCPASAIVFGNLNDPDSRVSRLAASPHAYRVLEELNRQPSVYYVTRVRNTDESETA
jgi:molybdopterin-containing oxidoreductase family iron-sulfur binding subunit